MIVGVSESWDFTGFSSIPEKERTPGKNVQRGFDLRSGSIQQEHSNTGTWIKGTQDWILVVSVP